MKQLMIILTLVVTCGLFTACGDDDWGNDNPAMEHIYYYGLGNVNYPGGNELQYDVAQGGTVEVPTFSVCTNVRIVRRLNTIHHQFQMRIRNWFAGQTIKS